MSLRVKAKSTEETMSNKADYYHQNGRCEGLKGDKNEQAKK